jgi:Tfp pilus assembly protein PilF
MAAYARGELKEMTEGLQRIVRHDRTHTRAYTYLGMAYNNWGRYDEALAAYDKAKELEPRNPNILHNRGISLRNKGECAMAINDYSRALKLKPDDKKVARILVDRGLAYRAMRIYNKALEDYDSSLASDPNLGEGYYGRSRVHMRLGNSLQRLADLEKAVQVEPGNELWAKELKEAQAAAGVAASAAVKNKHLAPADGMSGLGRIGSKAKAKARSRRDKGSSNREGESSSTTGGGSLDKEAAANAASPRRIMKRLVSGRRNSRAIGEDGLAGSPPRDSPTPTDTAATGTSPPAAGIERRSSLFKVPRLTFIKSRSSSQLPIPRPVPEVGTIALVPTAEGSSPPGDGLPLVSPKSPSSRRTGASGASKKHRSKRLSVMATPGAADVTMRPSRARPALVSPRSEEATAGSRGKKKGTTSTTPRKGMRTRSKSQTRRRGGRKKGRGRGDGEDGSDDDASSLEGAMDVDTATLSTSRRVQALAAGMLSPTHDADYSDGDGGSEGDSEADGYSLSARPALSTRYSLVSKRDSASYTRLPPRLAVLVAALTARDDAAGLSCPLHRRPRGGSPQTFLKLDSFQVPLTSVTRAEVDAVPVGTQAPLATTSSLRAVLAERLGQASTVHLHLVRLTGNGVGVRIGAGAEPSEETIAAIVRRNQELRARVTRLRLIVAELRAAHEEARAQVRGHQGALERLGYPVDETGEPSAASDNSSRWRKRFEEAFAKSYLRRVESELST